MNQSIISNRYAKALMMAGVENHCIEALKADMEWIGAIISENPAFRQMLDNPLIKPQHKRKVMNDLFDKKMNSLTINLFNIIIHNRREPLLANVARNFIDLYEKSKGIKRAHVTSATRMDKSAEQRLQKQLNELFKADVQITAETNSDLIGGFIFRVGDQQYDASLASALNQLRKTMID